jgi:hypothetical protein
VTLTKAQQSFAGIVIRRKSLECIEDEIHPRKYILQSLSVYQPSGEQYSVTSPTKQYNNRTHPGMSIFISRLFVSNGSELVSHGLDQVLVLKSTLITFNHSERE